MRFLLAILLIFSVGNAKAEMGLMEKIIITRDMSIEEVKKIFEKDIVGKDVTDLSGIIGQKFEAYTEDGTVHIYIRFRSANNPMSGEIVYIISVRYKEGKAEEIIGVKRKIFGL